MTLFLQLLLIVFLIPLTLGPVGHYLALNRVSPDLIIVVAWAFTWFGNRMTGVRWAVLAGLLIDTITYFPFGTWTLTLTLVVLVIDWLKNRYLEVSSFSQALLTLALGSALGLISVSLLVRSFDWQLMLLGILINLLIGVVVYYVLAIRFNFLHRWTGRRL